MLRIKFIGNAYSMSSTEEDRSKFETHPDLKDGEFVMNRIILTKTLSEYTDKQASN